MAEPLEDIILDSYYTELAMHHQYLLLAETAPTAEARRFMLLNADDEHAHAEEFQYIYEEMTGKEPPPEKIRLGTWPGETPFREHLSRQVSDVWPDIQKYVELYRHYKHPPSRDTLFGILQDELLHLMLNIYLIKTERSS